MGIGGGDKPQYTVDSLLEMILSASHAVMGLLGVLTVMLFARLRALGIEQNESGPTIVKS